jgi:DNA-binding GntR family transcriptional regulator
VANQANDNRIDLAVYRRQFAHLQKAADVVREALREAILDGSLAPGARLREEELAREFGVSRTPVREALQQLAANNLVELIPHQGAVVARLTTEDILALYVVREVLEGLSARLAALHATDEQVAALSAILDDMDAAARRDDAPALALLNLRFHAELRHIADNRYLDRFLTQVEHAVRRFSQTTSSSPGRTETSIGEHRALVESIRARDPESAEALAIRHMREARQIRLLMLSEGR